MVYLRGPSVKTIFLLAITLVVLNLTKDVEAGTIKFAYTKPIFGKANTIKENRFMFKSNFNRKVPIVATFSSSTSPTPSTSTRPTTPTTAQALAPTRFIVEETTTPLLPEVGLKEHEIISDHSIDNVGAESKTNMQEIDGPLADKRLADEGDTHIPYMVINRPRTRVADSNTLPDIEPIVNNTLEVQQQSKQQGLCEVTEDAEIRIRTRETSSVETNDAIEELYPLPSPELLIAPRTRNTPTKTSKSTTITATESGRPVPCTCGIFLSSQIKRSSKEQPEGEPVINNELDRAFTCNSVGQKQCQTKCLETLVQHLPNSANILCATLNRDCRKERAYLFIKNCRNQWFNTNLSAGREYCCRDGQPYACPLV